MARFEKVSKYAAVDIPLPARGTADAAGYDFVVAEDIVIPSWDELQNQLYWDNKDIIQPPVILDQMAAITKLHNTRPTLIPTGIKCYLDKGQYLELSVRSSTPLKHWLILANGVGIIDRDYVNNPDNEGAIFFQVINLSPFPIRLKRGDKIGQGIIKRYETVENDAASGQRIGGFGSTTEGRPQ